MNMKTLFLIVISTLVLSACGAGATGEEGHPFKEEEKHGSDWNKMEWDKGKWQ